MKISFSFWFSKLKNIQFDDKCFSGNISYLCSALCIRETPKYLLQQTVKTLMKCSIMLHFIMVCAVCLGKNSLQGQKYILI